MPAAWFVVRNVMGSTRTKLAKLFRVAVHTAAVLFAVQLMFAILGPPRWLTDWLRCARTSPHPAPRAVVVLGGSGVPSDQTLLRLYFAAEFGRSLTGAVFVCALPADEDPATTSVGRMRDELVLRGIPREAIRLETRGRSTHQQAVHTRELLGAGAGSEPIVVVTSGYHLRRAWLAFRAAGFTNATVLAAHNVDNEADSGWFAGLRYGFWGTLGAQAEIVRELVAIAAYKLRGWA